MERLSLWPPSNRDESRHRPRHIRCGRHHLRPAHSSADLGAPVRGSQRFLIGRPGILNLPQVRIDVGGIIRCAICRRKMYGTTRKGNTFYRCNARTLVPGSRALDAGWEPDVLKDQYNAAVAERRAAETELDATRATAPLTEDDARTLLESIEDVKQTLATAHKADLAQLYQSLGLSISYDHAARVADVTIELASQPGRAKVRVRGGT